jgi:putative hydrolase of HD superfamily
MIDKNYLKLLMDEAQARNGGMVLNVDGKPSMVMMTIEKYNQMLAQTPNPDSIMASVVPEADVREVPLFGEAGRTLDLKPIVNFLFEVGILAKTPRSGFHFLGSGQQSVSEHICRVMYIGFTLAQMERDVDTGKVLQMCLFHDVSEARTSDLNYVHQKYADSDEGRALKDLTDTLEFGPKIMDLLLEFKARKSKESLLAKDSDILEWILALKEEADIGNKRAVTWLPSAVKRLKTKPAKDLAEKILATNSDDWWFGNKEDDWWVSRTEEKTKNRF